MNIMILVNKDFEYAGYRAGVEYQMTRGKTPHLQIKERKTGTIYDFFESSCDYDLVTDSDTHKIREYCISYLFSAKENSSNSQIKFNHLKKLLDDEGKNGFVPDYIISVSTSESTPEMQGNGSINGCVVMGSKFYAKDCSGMDRPKKAEDKSNLKFPEFYYVETNDTLFYDFYNLINTNQQVLTDGMMPARFYPTKKLACISNPNYVSLGVVNITNYTRYKKADPETYKEYIEDFVDKEKKDDKKFKELIPEGLETTHAVVKMAALEKGNIPVLFVSPIVDRYERFDDDVDGKWGEQNRRSSFNAGVAVANMLEYFRNELKAEKSVTEVTLLECVKMLSSYCDSLLKESPTDAVYSRVQDMAQSDKDKYVNEYLSKFEALGIADRSFYLQNRTNPESREGKNTGIGADGAYYPHELFNLMYRLYYYLYNIKQAKSLYPSPDTPDDIILIKKCCAFMSNYIELIAIKKSTDVGITHVPDAELATWKNIRQEMHNKKIIYTGGTIDEWLPSDDGKFRGANLMLLLYKCYEALYSKT